MINPHFALRRVKAHFVGYWGISDAKARARLIAKVPRKKWKGQNKYKLWCNADFGIGPHEMWVDAHVLWSLIDLTKYKCPWHK